MLEFAPVDVRSAERSDPDRELSRDGLPYVLITGAARGIGRALSCCLVTEGAHRLAALDRSNIALDEAERNRWRRAGVRYYRADISREDDVRSVIEDLGRHGPVCGLVNNAGVYPRTVSISASFDEWMDVIRVNLGGTFLMSRTVAPLMQRAGHGSIVNVASGRAILGAPDGSHYAASKGGIVSLTRSLAREWALQIRVNVVMPEVTDTTQPRQSGISDERLYGLGTDIPLGRIGRPDDLWGAVTSFSVTAPGS